MRLSLCALLLGALPGLAEAATPRRGPPPPKPPETVWEEGRRDDVVIVKLKEGVRGVPTMDGAEVRPVFEDGAALRALRDELAPGLADLSLYFRVEVAPGWGPAVADAFNEQGWVELATLAPEAQPPPMDIPPETPDFSPLQIYPESAPDGFGVTWARTWPGGAGAGVTVADLEYGWTAGHEDLIAADAAETWGFDSGLYEYHGNGVLGILFAGDNGYGVTGLVPEATPMVIFPFVEADLYDIAAAIAGATTLLGPGDVLLIEQQAYAQGAYCPVEVDQAVFDAISLAVAKGIIVIEPGGNGAQNLDDPKWGGRFDRAVRDSGAVMVGGGMPPGKDDPARTWYPYGGSYGARVDVQGWFSDTVTVGSDSAGLNELFFPDSDPNQAYTARFGGTSGASAQLAGVAGALSAIHLHLHGAPPDPLLVRSWLAAFGTPQPSYDAANPIGPQPDLGRVLRMGLLP